MSVLRQPREIGGVQPPKILEAVEFGRALLAEMNPLDATRQQGNNLDFLPTNQV